MWIQFRCCLFLKGPSVAVMSHSPLCLNLLSPDTGSPLTARQLSSDSEVWADSLTTIFCLWYLPPPRSLLLSVGFVTTGGDGENSGPQHFPATAQKIAVQRGAHLSHSAPGPLGPRRCGKSRGGCPTEWAGFLGSRPVTTPLHALATASRPAS